MYNKLTHARSHTHMHTRHTHTHVCTRTRTPPPLTHTHLLNGRPVSGIGRPAAGGEVVVPGVHAAGELGAEVVVHDLVCVCVCVCDLRVARVHTFHTQCQGLVHSVCVLCWVGATLKF